MKKELLYPIFLECCQYTSDIFWENIFEDLAYGKTPYGTYVSKNFLICNNKKKNFSYKITFNDPKTLPNTPFWQRVKDDILPAAKAKAIQAKNAAKK